jgi:hypothetical protein
MFLHDIIVLIDSKPRDNYCRGRDQQTGLKAEPVFVDLLRRPGIDSQPGGPVRNPICRTGPPGYIGWRNRFLGIDA